MVRTDDKLDMWMVVFIFIVFFFLRIYWFFANKVLLVVNVIDRDGQRLCRHAAVAGCVCGCMCGCKEILQRV